VSPKALRIVAENTENAKSLEVVETRWLGIFDIRTKSLELVENK
jgi:hypothetical protein